MCRTLITIAANPKEKEQRETMRHILVNQMKNAVEKKNTHGFFIQAYGGNTPLRARTHSVHTWLNALYAAIDGGAKAIHSHARYVSRGTLNQAGIHGWNFNGYSCAHNGTVYLDKNLERTESDSYNVFQYIFHQQNMTRDDILERIQELFEDRMWVGTGTFTMMTGTHTIVVSVNRDTVLSQINGHILNVVSNPDVNEGEFKERIPFDYRRQIRDSKNGLIVFKGKTVRESLLYKTNPPEDLDSVDYISSNEILVINNDNLQITERIPLNPKPSFVNLHEYDDVNPQED